MPDKAWKQFEREAAGTFGGKRKWSNSGERLDFETELVAAQCKLVKNLSLNQLTLLAEEMAVVGRHTGKLGLVCTKVRRGCGRTSPMLITMTREQFLDWLDFRPQKGRHDGQEEGAGIRGTDDEGVDR